MLNKSSIFMMLLVATASLVVITSMYQPTNVESQPPEKIVATGTVNGVTVYASSDGKACLAAVTVSKTANRVVELLTSDANICDLLGKAKEGGLKLSFEGMKVDLSVIPQGFRKDFHPDIPLFVYRVHKVQLY
jgi:hypothetical protein